MNCQFCQSELLEYARFCHHCGAKVKAKEIECGSCHFVNPGDARFCTQCGFSFVVEEPVVTSTKRGFSSPNPSPNPSPSAGEAVTYEPVFPLNFRKTKGVASEIKQFFIQTLDQRIKDTQNPKMLQLYMNRLMQSDFQQVFELRTNQLAEEAYTIHSTKAPSDQPEIDGLLMKSFDGLIDYFLIKYCNDINEVKIPESALKYEGLERKDINLQNMILDFLDLKGEELAVYVDFITMPLQKLQNASRSFLFPSKDEKVLLIVDQTVFGSCREGFALSENAIYWKAHFKDAAQVNYRDIQTIKKEQDWILINDLFFNVNPTVNGKMMYLLKKMKKLG